MIQLTLHTSGRFFIMDAIHSWPSAREYSIWNAAVAALQFWMADLNPQSLSNTIEWVYTAFSCSTSSQQLRSTSEEVLFDHFVTMLNDAFEWGTCPGRWRLWEWEWKLKYSHSSMQSTMPASCFRKWQFVFWACHTLSILTSMTWQS